ncbi:hypothetical protein LXA43DRAFT_1102989 [Ganoderma leucocontextum]|nr:hypothetical protein LXA43DRAFT_1102989 [Ganoderma leucocontextum]
MFQTAEEREQLIVPIGVLFAFALLIVMRRTFYRATPLAVPEEVYDGVSSRHMPYSQMAGKRREGISAGRPRRHLDFEDKTPTYQRAKSILRAEQPSVLHDVAAARARKSFTDEVFPSRAHEEIWHDNFEDEQASASRITANQLPSRKAEASTYRRRAHSLSEDDIGPPAPRPRQSTPVDAVSLVSMSRNASSTMLRPSDDRRVRPEADLTLGSGSGMAVSRSRFSTPAPEPAQEDDRVSTRRSLFAHHPLPALREDGAAEEIYEDTFSASAPLPPKIPPRCRSATPDVQPRPMASRSSRTRSEAPPAPTPALFVDDIANSQVASSAAQVQFSQARAPSVTSSASRAPSIAPSVSRAPSLAPSVSRTPSMTPTSRAPSAAPTASISQSSQSTRRSEVLPPRTGSSAGHHSSGHAAASHRVSASCSSVWTPTELAAKYPRQVYRRPQTKAKTGSRRFVGSDDTMENEDDDQSGGYIVTAWFESKSDTLLQCPPDLRLHPELQLGDIYYHSTASRYQLWCRVLDNKGEPFWDEAYWAYERNGLFLTLTGSLQRPSWVNKRRLATREREIGMQQDAVQIKKEADA